MPVRTVVLRGGVEITSPLELALEFVEAYPSALDRDSLPWSFAESDLRRANRGGARISAAQIAAILERREEIEGALREIRPDASLASAGSSVPWPALRRLFDAFGGIRGVGFSKMTKALHEKRPALIPMLDSVVQAYLTSPSGGSFGEQATVLVRSYKEDLDRNRLPLLEVKRELARRGHELSEVRILDVLIWSLGAG
jgi:Family of unknown function (DUF6308)